MSDDYLLVKNMFSAFLYSSGPKHQSIFSVQICISTNMTGQAGACMHMNSTVVHTNTYGFQIHKISFLFMDTFLHIFWLSVGFWLSSSAWWFGRGQGGQSRLSVQGKFKQCCGSWMFIPDPRSWILVLIFTHPGSRIPDLRSRISDPGSRIPDLGSRIQKQQKKRGVKKIICHTFFCSHKFHKIVNYFIFGMLKKKNLANFQRIIELFTQKIGFGIQDPSPGSVKTYYGSQIQGSKRHQIQEPDPQHWKICIYKRLELAHSVIICLPKKCTIYIFTLSVKIQGQGNLL